MSIFNIDKINIKQYQKKVRKLNMKTNTNKINLEVINKDLRITRLADLCITANISYMLKENHIKEMKKLSSIKTTSLAQEKARAKAVLTYVNKNCNYVDALKLSSHYVKINKCKNSYYDMTYKIVDFLFNINIRAYNTTDDKTKSVSKAISKVITKVKATKQQAIAK